MQLLVMARRYYSWQPCGSWRCSVDICSVMLLGPEFLLSSWTAGVSTNRKASEQEGGGRRFRGCHRTSWGQLQEMLATLSVVVIARIINQIYQLCVDETCLQLFNIDSLTPPPPQSLPLSSPTQLSGFCSLSSCICLLTDTRHNGVQLKQN